MFKTYKNELKYKVCGKYILITTLIICISILQSFNFISSSNIINSRNLLDNTEDDTICSSNYNNIFSIIFFLFLNVSLILYIFYIFHILCENYFIYSLEAICNVLHLSEDIAGATFLAAGSSLPELISTLDDVFIVKNAIGLGTNVGSAIFNILFGLSICSFIAPMNHQIQWQAVYRDLFYYMISIIFIVIFFYDGYVYWYESIMLLIMYAIYILHLLNNNAILEYLNIPLPSNILLLKVKMILKVN